MNDCDFVQSVTFSPDGRILASAGYEREPGPGGELHACIRLWEVASGREIAKLVGPSNTSGVLSLSSMGGLAFTPDSRVLVSADCGGNRRLETSAIRFWDVATGRELAQIDYKASSIMSLAVDPDGKRFVTGLQNGTALVWEIPATAKPPSEPRAKKLGPKELAALWEDLAHDDAKAAHEAVRILANAPEQSVPFPAKSLRPAAKIDFAKVRQRITELGDDEFKTRETASRELKHLGEDVEEELRKGLVDNPSPEAVQRLRSILSAVSQSPPPARLQELRGVWVLELIGTPQAKEILADLGRGEPNARLTREAKAALERK
jgi:dipeptidyl aminopeptidase/acylaminoacyl peptidase